MPYVQLQVRALTCDRHESSQDLFFSYIILNIQCREMFQIEVVFLVKASVCFCWDVSKKKLNFFSLKRLVTEGWMDRIHPSSGSGGHPCLFLYSISSSPVSFCVWGMWVHWHTWSRVSVYSLQYVVFREGVDIRRLTVTNTDHLVLVTNVFLTESAPWKCPSQEGRSCSGS